MRKKRKIKWVVSLVVSFVLMMLAPCHFKSSGTRQTKQCRRKSDRQTVGYIASVCDDF